MYGDGEESEVPSGRLEHTQFFTQSQRDLRLRIFWKRREQNVD